VQNDKINIKVYAVCSKCPHKNDCKKPCEPVRYYLYDGESTAMEKIRGRDEQGRAILVNYGFNHEVEVRFSELEDSQSKQGKEKDFVEKKILNIQDSPFQSFEPQFLQTKIFIDRYLKGMSFEDIGKKHDISTKAAASISTSSKMRFLNLMRKFDTRQEGIKALNHKKYTLLDEQKFFLLNKVFGFTAREISAMFGGIDMKYISAAVGSLFKQYQKYFPEEPDLKEPEGTA